MARSREQKAGLLVQMERRVEQAALSLEEKIARETAQLEQLMLDAEIDPDAPPIRKPVPNPDEEAQKARERFGLYSAAAAAASAASPANGAANRSPFTPEEITLVRVYMEELYENSINMTEKRTIDNLRDFMGEIMGDPIRLKIDGKTYDRQTLLTMIAQGKNYSPINRKMFSVFDFEPDLNAISAISEFLTDAQQKKKDTTLTP